MTATASVPTPKNVTFTYLDLKLLHESPLNPRKHYDPARLDELKGSIERSGILEPLLVRPNKTGYEIAGGHRRFRASKLAGVTSLPCIVREMDDATFLEVMTIDNLQREDLHPLEEAQGYKNLLTLDGYDVKKISDRVKVSESHVYDRLKLLDLIAPAKKLFLANRFTIKHAIILARLSKTDQKRCLGLDEESYDDHGGMWESQGDAHPPLGLDDPTYVTDERDPFEGRKARSVAELQAWVNDHVRFTEPDDATPHLFAETAANLTAAEEAKTKVVEISRDHQLKVDAKHPDGKRTYCRTSWKRADGQLDGGPYESDAPSKTCDYSVLGLVVAGFGRGDSFRVCIAKKKCTTHWGEEIRARNQRAKAAKKRSDSTKEKVDSWQEEEQKRQERGARFVARWEKGGTIVLTAIADKLKALPIDSTGVAGTWLWKKQTEHAYGLGDFAKIATKVGIGRGRTAVDWIRHAVMCRLVIRSIPDRNGWDDREAALQKSVNDLGLKVNVKQLLDAANPEPKVHVAAKTASPKKKKKKAA